MEGHLLSVDDVQLAKNYPYERSVGSVHSRYCTVCEVNVAEWITTTNVRVISGSNFMCWI